MVVTPLTIHNSQGHGQSRTAPGVVWRQGLQPKLDGHHGDVGEKRCSTDEGNFNSSRFSEIFRDAAFMFERSKEHVPASRNFLHVFAFAMCDLDDFFESHVTRVAPRYRLGQHSRWPGNAEGWEAWGVPWPENFIENTLWQTNITMENHHFQWVNPLFPWWFSMANC